jgi:hypothetical protein
MNSIGLAEPDAEGPKWLLKKEAKNVMFRFGMSPCSARKAPKRSQIKNTAISFFSTVDLSCKFFVKKP